jgi:hypothetical protein
MELLEYMRVHGSQPDIPSVLFTPAKQASDLSAFFAGRLVSPLYFHVERRCTRSTHLRRFV